MKKLFVMALATIGMVACVNEKLEMPKSQITFAGASIDNVVRSADPSFKPNASNLNQFNVWAFMDNTSGQVFVNELVSKVNNVWTYTNIQYWAPNHTYYFAALAGNANATVDTTNANTNGLGVVTFENMAGDEDLVYAAQTVTTPSLEVLSSTTMAPVELHFNHLLSKVKFTFKNGFATNNTTVLVEDITMTAPKKASIDLAVENWWDGDDWVLDTTAGTLDLQFGDVDVMTIGQSKDCTTECLTIPVGSPYSYDIAFTIKVFVGDVLAMEVDKNVTVSSVAFEMGKAYNFTAEISPETLNLKQIDFTVSVEGWKNTNVAL